MHATEVHYNKTKMQLELHACCQSIPGSEMC